MKKSFFFLFFVCIISASFSFADSQDILKRFPYKINFTEKELNLLNSLDEETLEKLIQVAKSLVAKNNIKAGTFSSPGTNNTGQPGTDSGSGPVQTSNSPSTQTPYYNPESGRFQSSPASNRNANSYFNSPYNSYGNQYGGGALDKYYPTMTPNSSTPGVCTREILDICKPNYGVDVSGGCSTKNLESAPITGKLKADMMCACSIIGKRLPSASVYRTGAQQVCANPSVGNSQHTHGTAIDLSQSGLTSDQKKQLYFFFKSSGYRHGCYGPAKHVHFDHGLPNNYYNGACPAELIIQLRGFGN